MYQIQESEVHPISNYRRSSRYQDYNRHLILRVNVEGMEKISDGDGRPLKLEQRQAKTSKLL